MKKFTTIIAVLLLSGSVFAQAPQKMSYQAVIRDISNVLVKSTSIGMQISILEGSESGTAVYVERHFPVTNSNGLASIEIGSGTVVSGSFATINWAIGPYFLKTETDLNGGANYTISGTSQLLSVPYALYAETSGSETSQTAFHVSGSGSWQPLSETESETYISWENEDYDLSNDFSDNTFTAPSNGVYHFDAVVQISFGSSISNQAIALCIYKNGFGSDFSKIQGSSSDSFAGNLSTTLSLSAGDQIKLVIYLIGGTGINVDGGGPKATHFSGYKVY